MCVSASGCFIKGKKHKELQFPRLLSLDGFQSGRWLLLINYHVNKDRKRTTRWAPALSRLCPPLPASFPIATERLKVPKHKQNSRNCETINQVCLTSAAVCLADVHPVWDERGCTHCMQRGGQRLTGKPSSTHRSMCQTLQPHLSRW